MDTNGERKKKDAADEKAKRRKIGEKSRGVRERVVGRSRASPRYLRSLCTCIGGR